MRYSTLLLATALLLPAVVTTFAAKSDPIEGKWVGTLGDTRANNLSVVGLEFRLNPEGELRYTFCVEQLNVYGIPSPDPVKIDGNHYRAPSFDLELKDDKLSGTFGLAKRAVTFTRTEQMPAEKPIPTELSSGPGPKWERKIGGEIYANAAAYGDFIYVGSTMGGMVALKASDGSVAWSFPSGRAIMGEALVTEDSVFFVCDNGYLFKLNRADGKELWRYDLGDARVTRILPNPIIQPQDGYDHLAPKPVLAEDTLYVGAGDGGFHAVRADSGERVWRIQSKGAIRSTAAVRGPNVFFSTMEGLVVALERSGGRQLWQVQSQLPVTSSPVFVGDKLVIGGRDSILQALDPATGAQLWKFSFWGSWVESSATPSPENDGVAYIGSSDLRRVTSFDANAGRILWRTDVFGCPWGRPLVTDKFVYVATIGSKPYPMRHEAAIVALERATGRLLWRWALPQPAGVYFWGFPGSITRAGELMVIGGMDGTLYAFPTQ